MKEFRFGTEGTPTPGISVSVENKAVTGTGFVSVVDKGVKVVCFDADSRNFVSVESKGFTTALLASVEFKKVAEGRQVGRGRFVRVIENSSTDYTKCQ